jgi:hypothetical protein
MRLAEHFDALRAKTGVEFALVNPEAWGKTHQGRAEQSSEEDGQRQSKKMLRESA